MLSLRAGGLSHRALSGVPGLPGDRANDGLSYQGRTPCLGELPKAVEKQIFNFSN